MKARLCWCESVCVRALCRTRSCVKGWVGENMVNFKRL